MKTGSLRAFQSAGVMAFLVFTPLLRGELVLEFQIDETAKALPLAAHAVSPADLTQPKSNPLPPPKSYPATLALGTDYAEIKTPEEVRVYDFKNRRIYFTDLHTSQRRDDSLFSSVYFNVMEFGNRQFLAGALKAGGVTDDPMGNEIVLEHLFSLALPGKVSPLEPRQQGETTSFTAGDKPLFTYGAEALHLSHAEAGAFVRALRYFPGLHPHIAEFLQKSSGVPKQFEVVQYNMGQAVTRRFSFTASHQHDDRPLAVLKVDTTPSGDLDALTAQARTALAALTPPLGASLVAEAVRLAQAGKNLDSLLLFLAYNMTTGLPLPPEFATYRSQFTSDEPCKVMLSAVSNPSGEEDARNRIARLQSLEGQVTEGKESLLIFEANHTTTLNRTPDAEALFDKALRIDPLVAGAWKDYGQCFASQYRMAEAWECWDLARKIAPDHGMLRSLNEMEAKLQHDFPEFF